MGCVDIYIYMYMYIYICYLDTKNRSTRVVKNMYLYTLYMCKCVYIYIAKV